MSQLGSVLVCSVLLCTVMLSGCLGSKPKLRDADEEGADAPGTDQSPTPPAPVAQESSATSDSVGDVFVYQEAAGDAAATAEFADVNPFDYQNPWR